MAKSNGKVAFVTGASSGIGFAVSVELAKRGYKVYAGARRVDVMKPLEKFGIIPVSLDVTSAESISAARELIESENDHLDILLNNAGVIGGAPAIEVSDEDFTKCYEVNLYGPIRVTREFSKLIIKGKGLFAYTTSNAGIMPIPFTSIYSSSKAALSAYASTLAFEVKPFGVKVLDFVSGGVKTEIMQVEHPVLNADSLYRIDGRDLLKEVGDNFDPNQYMDVAVYAVKAANDIESALNSASFFSSANYFRSFRGTMASFSRFATSFIPRGVLETLLLLALKLSDGFKLIKKKYSAKSK
ncbi:NADPH-dependent 1-acyldihydroxyacetone phosphate reductase [[Candida] railenensis]|uniref:NADPH-dependent 1-acyldihydroxyacetone phosphate reductase n=1 Tax=[Candida] railenensis TaxID=45579 RepID=A0A9P0VZU8_9ASCO|nr:NADPH-dependent 1-acyldihydroxyacetone phosphate reductase [[Candida] railenensis]